MEAAKKIARLLVCLAGGGRPARIEPEEPEISDRNPGVEAAARLDRPPARSVFDQRPGIKAARMKLTLYPIHQIDPALIVPMAKLHELALPILLSKMGLPFV